jgi:hypothetical protein
LASRIARPAGIQPGVARTGGFRLFFFAGEKTSLFNQPKTANTRTVIPYSSWFIGDLSSFAGTIAAPFRAGQHLHQWR